MITIQKINATLCVFTVVLMAAVGLSTTRRANAALPAGPCPNVINATKPCPNGNPIVRVGRAIPVCSTVGPYSDWVAVGSPSFFRLPFIKTWLPFLSPIPKKYSWYDCCSYLKRDQVCRAGWTHGSNSYLRGRQQASACSGGYCLYSGQAVG